MTLRLAGPLLLVGAGKMGGALLEGWLRQGLDPTAVFIQDPAPPPEVVALAARHGIAAGDAPDLPAPPSVIVVAVKPGLVDKLLAELEPLIDGSVILSVAAGRADAAKRIPEVPVLAAHGRAESLALPVNQPNSERIAERDVVLQQGGRERHSATSWSRSSRSRASCAATSSCRLCATVSPSAARAAGVMPSSRAYAS